MEAYIDISRFGLTERKSYLKSLYDYYNGVVDETDYRHVLKPYGKARENFPSKLRNYPIIKPIIDLLVGEKSKRPINFTVTVSNGDSISKKEFEKNKKLTATAQQIFIKALQGEAVSYTHLTLPTNREV